MFRLLRTHGYFWAILLCYVSLTTWLIFRLPAFTGPNEHLHFEVVSWLQRYHELPNPALSQRMDQRHQPPLYYLAAAAAGAFFPGPPLDNELSGNPYLTATHRGNLNVIVHANPSTVPTLYAGRFVSLFFGIVALVAIYLAARLTLPVSESALVAALMAFQPYHLYLGAVLGNDSALVAMSALLLATATRLIVRPALLWHFAGWGLLLGLGLLTKATAAFLLLLLPFACLAQVQLCKSWRRAILCGLAAICGLLPIWGGWQLYNLTHGMDALGLNRSAPLSSILRLSFNDYQTFLPYLANVWRSFWLDWSAEGFGYAADWVYWLLAGLVLLALIGWLRTTRFLDQPMLLSWMHFLWIIPFVLTFLATKSAMLKQYGFIVTEARWLQPIVPSVAWLLAIGLLRLFHERNWRYYSALYGFGLLAVVGNLALAIWQVPQTFPSATKLSDFSQIAAGAVPVELNFGDQLQLRAIDVPTMTIGMRSRLALYWQALTDLQKDYTVSTQLLLPTGEVWHKLDWQNSYPGSGLNPTAGWRAGDTYRDQIILEPNGELNGPTLARLGIWVLEDVKPQVVLPAMRDGTEIDPPIVTEVVLYPSQFSISPEATMVEPSIRYGNLFELIAAEQHNDSVSQRLTLYWRAQTPSSTSYTVFVHLLDANGQVVAQADSVPNLGLSPTTIWRSGDLIRDPHRISQPLCASCTYRIGFYDAATGNRLPAQQNGKDLPDQAFSLTMK